jgi:hypothetical protein
MQSNYMPTKVVEAKFEDGVTIRIQAVALGGEERVAGHLGPLAFEEVTRTIESLANAVVSTLKKVKPRAASVEFGIEIGVEPGKLTALLVKGTGTANLKVVLQWGEMDDSISM